MTHTPVSLLEQLRRPDDREAWDRFVRLYTPFLYFCAQRAGLQESDAADLVQDVFLTLLRHLPTFTYDSSKSFRAWLRTVTLNRWRARCRRGASHLHAAGAAAEEAVGPDTVELFAEDEYRRHVARRALELMQEHFQATTWQACWEHAVSGRSAADVARELGMTEGAVYVAKCRVLRRLRQELNGLFD